MKTNIIKSIIVLALGHILLTACSEKETQCKAQFNNPCPWCETENPIEELPWLKSMTDDFCSLYLHVNIYVCTYNSGNKGFLVEQLCADGFTCLYDCQGNMVGYFGGIDGRHEGDFSIDEGSRKLIYTSGLPQQ